MTEFVPSAKAEGEELMCRTASSHWGQAGVLVPLLDGLTVFIAGRAGASRTERTPGGPGLLRAPRNEGTTRPALINYADR